MSNIDSILLRNISKVIAHRHSAVTNKLITNSEIFFTHAGFIFDPNRCTLYIVSSSIKKLYVEISSTIQLFPFPTTRLSKKKTSVINRVCGKKPERTSATGFYFSPKTKKEKTESKRKMEDEEEILKNVEKEGGS